MNIIRVEQLRHMGGSRLRRDVLRFLLYVKGISDHSLTNRWIRSLGPWALGTYHPPQLLSDSPVVLESSRDVGGRLRAMNDYLKTNDIDNFSALDIGCAQGYFSLGLSRSHSCSVWGIDADELSVGYASAWGAVQPGQALDSPYFLTLKLEHESLKSFPTFDVCLLLGLYHHLIVQWGLAGAQSFLRSVSDISSRVCFFEMATSTEKGAATDNGRLLPFMGDNSDEFIVNMLVGAGFATVQNLGSFSIGGDQSRSLFAASKF